MWARKNGGRFLLRLDDTDAERSREEYVDAIRADLGWLGLAFDGEERQSARFALYEQRFDTLKEAGRVYPCYETAQTLDLKRAVLLGRGFAPVSDRSALALSDVDTAEFEAEEWLPHWRFRIDHDSPIRWLTLITGGET